MKKLNISKKLLFKLYHKDKKSTGEIARKLNCNQTSIMNYLKKYNIPRRTLSQAHKGKYLGKMHPNWKGGKPIDGGGYILIYSPDNPYKNYIGYVREHRLVMEYYLGRYLKHEEIVHHINGNKSDNRIENLMLFPNQKTHYSFRHNNKKTFICKKCEHDQRKSR